MDGFENRAAMQCFVLHRDSSLLFYDSVVVIQPARFSYLTQGCKFTDAAYMQTGA